MEIIVYDMIYTNTQNIKFNIIFTQKLFWKLQVHN